MGNRELNYSAKLDISNFSKSTAEALKKAKELNAEIAKGKSFNTNNQLAAPGTAGISAYREAQLKMQEALRQSRLETERLKQEQQALKNTIEQGRIAQQNYRTETDRLKASEQALRIGLQQGRITQQQYNTQLSQGRLAQQGLNATLTQSRLAAQNARTSLAEYTLQQRQLADATRAARNAQTAASGSYREAQQRLRQLGDQIRSVNGGFQSQSPLMQARIREYNQLNERLKAFDASMGNHQRNVGNYRGALQGAGSDLVGLVSGYLSAGAALQYVLKTTMEFQRIKTPLTYILGSEGDANAKLSELKTLANELGIEYFALAASYKSFSAAARASNFDLVQSEKIFTSVTKASAVLGLSSEQLQGALTAIQQMISKGNVQAEELRGQLAERLPGAFALSAKAMGVTESELNKLLQTGQVLAQDLLPKLALELDKQYGDKAADGIRGLNAEWQRFITLLQSTAGESSALSRNIFEPILKGAGQVITLLNNSFRGSFTENFRYIFSLFNSTREQLKSVYDLRESFANNKGSLKGAQERDLTGAGLGELKTYYTQVDQTFKKAAKDYETFKKDIAAGTKVETATASLAGYARVVEGLAEQRNRIGAEVVKQKKQIATANKEVKEAVLTSVTDIRKEIARLSKMEGSAIIGSDVYKQIEVLKERLAKPKDTTASDYKAAEREATALGNHLTKLLAESSKASLSADEKEVESVKAKYEEMRKEAQKFYDNPKNSGLKVKVNGQNFSKSQVEGSINAMQDSDLKSIAEKEAAEVAKKANNEREKTYKAAYDAAISHEQSIILIRQKYKKYAKDLGTGITESQKAELIRQQDDEIRSANETAFQKTAIYKKLADETLVYTKEALKAEITAAKNILKDSDLSPALKADVEKHIEELNNALESGVNNSNANALEKRKKVLEVALVDPLIAGTDQAKEYQAELLRIQGLIDKTGAGSGKTADMFKGSTKDVANNISGGLGQLSGAFGELSSSLDGVNDGLAYTLGSIGELLKVGEDAAGAVASFASGDIIGGVTKTISAVAGLFSMGKKVKEMNAEARKEVADYYASAIAGEREYQDMLKQRQIENIRNNKIVLQGIRDEVALRSAQTAAYKKESAEIMAQLQGQSYVASETYKHGTWFRKAQVNKTYSSLKGMSFEQLSQLLTQGKLEGDTKALVERLKELEAKGYDAQRAIEDLAKETSQLFTGTTSDNLTNTLAQMFRDGKTSAQDLADFFKESMDDAALSIFKNKVLAGAMESFYKEFDTAAQSGDELTSDEIARLNGLFTSLTGDALKKFEGFQKITGSTLNASNGLNSKNSLQGSLTPITENSFEIKKNTHLTKFFTK